MKTDKINFSSIINIFEYKFLIEILIIVFGIILRLKLYFSNPSFFIDECLLGFNIINKSYSELFLPLNAGQCAPPFFLIISKLFLDLSHQQGNLYTQDLVLRAFPLFCSSASLPLFAIFLNKITSNKIFIWVCISMLTFNTCAINYSVQFKQYSCELMFTLILLLIFQCFDINKLSKKTLGLYTLIFCISIWFSNTAFIILATGFLYFFFKSFYYDFRKQINSNLPKISIIVIPFIINLVVYLCYLKGLFNSYLYLYMQNYWINKQLAFFSFDNFLILFPEKINALINIPFLSNAFLNIFLLFNIILLFVLKQNMEFKTKFFVLAPILFSIIASFFKLYPFQNRLILYLIPLYIILYCQVLCILKQSKTVKIITIMIIILLSYIKINTPTEEYNELNQPARKTAEFIIQNKIPTNKIIFSASYEPIDYYMHSFFTKDKILLYDESWNGFRTSKIPYILKKDSLNNDYYIFTPFAFAKFDNLSKNYNAELLNYLNNDKHLIILNVYTENGYIYIIHLKKKILIMNKHLNKLFL